MGPCLCSTGFFWRLAYRSLASIEASEWLTGAEMNQSSTNAVPIQGPCLYSTRFIQKLANRDEPIQYKLRSKTLNWHRFMIVRVPPLKIFWGTSRPMRGQHFKLSTNQKPRFRPDSRCWSNLRSTNPTPMCQLTENQVSLEYQLTADWQTLNWQSIAIPWVFNCYTRLSVNRHIGFGLADSRFGKHRKSGRNRGFWLVESSKSCPLIGPEDPRKMFKGGTLTILNMCHSSDF